MATASVVPSTAALLESYNSLQGKELINEANLVKFAHWSRFDPRLGEILVSYLKDHWKKINPMELRRKNMDSKSPQSLVVVLEHVALIDIQDKELFSIFLKFLSSGLKPAPYQSYFIGLYKLAGQQMKDQAGQPHPIFSKWGFYARDPMWSKNTFRLTPTQMDPMTRKRILRELLIRQRSITVNDYMTACHSAIHRRQAERDLKTFFKLKATGNTRGRRYSR